MKGVDTFEWIVQTSDFGTPQIPSEIRYNCRLCEFSLLGKRNPDSQEYQELLGVMEKHSGTSGIHLSILDDPPRVLAYSHSDSAYFCFELWEKGLFPESPSDSSFKRLWSFPLPQKKVEVVNHDIVALSGLFGGNFVELWSISGGRKISEFPEKRCGLFLKIPEKFCCGKEVLLTFRTTSMKLVRETPYQGEGVGVVMQPCNPIPVKRGTFSLWDVSNPVNPVKIKTSTEVIYPHSQFLKLSGRAVCEDSRELCLLEVFTGTKTRLGLNSATNFVRDITLWRGLYVLVLCHPEECENAKVLTFLDSDLRKVREFKLESPVLLIHPLSGGALLVVQRMGRTTIEVGTLVETSGKFVLKKLLEEGEVCVYYDLTVGSPPYPRLPIHISGKFLVVTKVENPKTADESREDSQDPEKMRVYDTSYPESVVVCEIGYLGEIRDLEVVGMSIIYSTTHSLATREFHIPSRTEKEFYPSSFGDIYRLGTSKFNKARVRDFLQTTMIQVPKEVAGVVADMVV